MIIDFNNIILVNYKLNLLIEQFPWKKIWKLA